MGLHPPQGRVTSPRSIMETVRKWETRHVHVHRELGANSHAELILDTRRDFNLLGEILELVEDLESVPTANSTTCHREQHRMINTRNYTPANIRPSIECPALTGLYNYKLTITPVIEGEITTATLDTGAPSCFISQQFSELLNSPLDELPAGIPVTFTNG
uniref:Uncharacterized protein n=1 Tax=Glossina austeni TaxID=7395 RepID=A0A1A9UM27_GLOAU